MKRNQNLFATFVAVGRRAASELPAGVFLLLAQSAGAASGDVDTLDAQIGPTN